MSGLPAHRRIARVASALGEALLDALAPPTCPACDSPQLVPGNQLCSPCRLALGRLTSEAYCPRCGLTAPPFGLRPTGCGKCSGENLPYTRVIRTGAYAGEMAALIRHYKYHGREELGAFLAAELARRIARAEIYEQIEALVPVPTCWQHRLRRRFYAAGALTQEVARACSIPLAPVLRRTGGGPHQAGQPLTTRQENVRGRFRMERACAVQRARLCLVDDVMTSGATVSECARVLRRAGAAVVYVAVLARAHDDPLVLARS